MVPDNNANIDMTYITIYLSFIALFLSFVEVCMHD